MWARIPGKCFHGFNDESKSLMLLEEVDGRSPRKEARVGWNWSTKGSKFKAVFPILTR